MTLRNIAIFITVLATPLHFSGVFYGLPLQLAGDEFVHVATAFLLLAERTIQANFALSYVPPLMAYLTLPGVIAFIGGGLISGVFESIAAAQQFAILNASYFIAIPRLISGLFFVLFLFAVFGLAKRLFSREVAYLSLIFAALSFQVFHESILGHFWLPSVALITASFYALYRMYETGTRHWYLLSALCIALAYAMGYIAVLVIPFAILLHFASSRRNHAYGALGLGVLGVLLAFFSWLNPVSFIRQFGRALEVAAHSVGVPLTLGIPVESGTADILSNFGFLLEVVVLDNPVLFVLALLGAFVLIRRRMFLACAVVIGFPMLYLIAGSFIWSHPDYRYALPVLPFVILSGTYALCVLWERARTALARTSIVVLASLALLYALLGVFSYVSLLAQEDTRLSARIWLSENVASDETVLIAVPYLEVEQDETALQFAQERGFTRTRDELVLAHPELITAPRLSAYYVSYFGNDVHVALAELSPDWYVHIVSNDAPVAGYERILVFENALRTCAATEDALGNPKALFEVFGLSNLGPCIEIYQRTK